MMSSKSEGEPGPSPSRPRGAKDGSLSAAGLRANELSPGFIERETRRRQRIERRRRLKHRLRQEERRQRYAAFSAVCLPTIASRQKPQHSNRIAFASDRDGDFEIFIMNADGSGLRQITHNEVPDVRPDWSPDGSSIVFVRDKTSESTTDQRIWVADVGAGTECTWPAGRRFMNGDYPVWSPDGKWFAFEVGDYDGSGVMAAKLDGTEVVRIASSDENSLNFEPTWSPDSRIIAYQDVYDYSTVRLRALRGRVPSSFRRHLTVRGGGSYNGPAWAPNRPMLVVAKGAYRGYDNDLSDTDSDLYVYTLEEVRRIEEHDPSATLGGSWSPDSTRIVMYSDRGGSFDIYTMGLHGENLHRLTTHPSNDITPDWST